MSNRIPHLRALEAESIHIIREVAAEFQNPVMLYSIGKDSAVMLRLARRRSTRPAAVPAAARGHDLEVPGDDRVPRRVRAPARPAPDRRTRTRRRKREGINPFDHGSNYTHVMKTQALKQALAQDGFDAAFGGARRDEEKSRAKERVYSFRDRCTRWDPKNQRPEFWNLYNGKVNNGREHPRLPAVQLDRAGRLAIHPPRTSRSCRCTSPRRGPSWSGVAASSWWTTSGCALSRARSRAARGALPHARLLPAHRARSSARPDPARDHGGDAAARTSERGAG